MSRARRLGEWIAGLEPADVGSERLERMRSHLLDTIGAAVAGHRSEATRIAEAVFRSRGEVPILCPGAPRDIVHAARVNAVAAHALEIDDTEGCDHTGAVVVPTLLAIAAADPRPVSGGEFLTAMTAGYEVGRRMQNALGGYDAHNGRGWHSTGTCGVFAAAAAAAKLLALPAEQVTAALAVAASSSAGSWAFADDGAMTKRFHPANAAGAGLDAARLSAAGVTGPGRIFDDTWGGYFALYGGPDSDPDELLDGLGERWHADHSAIKLYGSCRSAHAVLDGAVAFIAESGATAETLLRAEITVSPFLRPMICPERIDTVDAARMSLPVSIALLLVEGSLEPDAFERFSDPAVQDIAKRVRVSEDASAEAPRLVLEAGERSTVIIGDHARGSEGDPIPADEVRAKFLRLTRPHLTGRSREEILRYAATPAEAPMGSFPALRWTDR